jgi:hypothetical protein
MQRPKSQAVASAPATTDATPPEDSQTPHLPTLVRLQRGFSCPTDELPFLTPARVVSLASGTTTATIGPHEQAATTITEPETPTHAVQSPIRADQIERAGVVPSEKMIDFFE